MKEKSYSKVLLIVTEKHMYENMKIIQQHINALNLDTFCVFFPLISLSGINRLVHGRSILKQIRIYVLATVPKRFWENTLIIYSNAEGFFLSNKDKWLPKIHNCKEIGIQHGFMPLSNRQDFKRKVSLFLSHILNYNLVGAGFGGVKFDKIVVFGYIYKDFLVKFKEWEPKNVLIGSLLLKQNHLISNKGDENTCLFLLQNLYPTYISKDKMILYFNNIMSILLQRYDKVIVRKHPKMDNEIYKKMYPAKNIIFSTASLVEDIQSAKRIFSFFSTALLDAYLMGKEVVAIVIPEISQKTYERFTRSVEISQLKTYLEQFPNADNDAKIDSKYFDIKISSEDTFKEIIKKD